MQQDKWVDPASHHVTMIAVASRVNLEVLEWDGARTPMAFLAGLGDTGHAFDNFAVRFRDGFRPIAVTRRGFDASSRPDSGYDSATRSHDILAVLDSLHIARAVLVGLERKCAVVVITMPGATHYLHYRRADAVERSMRTSARIVGRREYRLTSVTGVAMMASLISSAKHDVLAASSDTVHSARATAF